MEPRDLGWDKLLAKLSSVDKKLPALGAEVNERWRVQTPGAVAHDLDELPKKR